MPLLGKIRLGVKKVSKNTGKEYPAEVDYFVCPPEVGRAFGPQPKSLQIMFPIDDIDSIFPTAYTFYGQSRGVKCKGDGERAWCVNDKTKEMEERPCPCEMLDAEKCKQVGRLLFMIPSVSVAGVYQITTSSYNSIVDVQSGLDFVRAMVGRFAFIELELKRIETTTHHNEQRQTHYTMQLTLPEGFNAQALADLRSDNERIHIQSQQYQLPAPAEENPEFDPPDIVADEENGGAVINTSPLPRDTDAKITDAQVKKLNACLREKSFVERAQKLDYVNKWLKEKGYKGVESSKDLTKEQASALIDELTSYENPAPAAAGGE
jgi:hypothetical protein